MYIPKGIGILGHSDARFIWHLGECRINEITPV